MDAEYISRPEQRHLRCSIALEDYSGGILATFVDAEPEFKTDVGIELRVTVDATRHWSGYLSTEWRIPGRSKRSYGRIRASVGPFSLIEVLGRCVGIQWRRCKPLLPWIKEDNRTSRPSRRNPLPPNPVVVEVPDGWDNAKEIDSDWVERPTKEAIEGWTGTPAKYRERAIDLYNKSPDHDPWHTRPGHPDRLVLESRGWVEVDDLGDGTVAVQLSPLGERVVKWHLFEAASGKGTVSHRPPERTLLPDTMGTITHLYAKMRRDADGLKREVTTDGLLNFVGSAYSMIDWVKKDPGVPDSARAGVDALYADRWIAICGDLANAAKHFTLDRRQPKVQATKSARGWGLGRFGMGSFGIGEEQITVRMRDGVTHDVLELVDGTLESWRAFMERHEIG